MPQDVAAHLMTMLDQVQAYFMHSLVGGVGRHPSKPESWAYVGSKTEATWSQLAAARRFFPETSRPKFLDCGSGLSFVTALADGLGFEARGVEWSEEYVSIAKNLFPSQTCIRADVFEFRGYAEYDVLYYYGLFADEALERRFEEKLEAEAKVGAIIIGNRKASSAWRASGNFDLLSASEDAFMGVLLRKIAAS